MVAYTKPQQRKKEESERLRGERDQIKFIDIRFEQWQVVRFRKAGRRQIISTRNCTKLTSNFFFLSMVIVGCRSRSSTTYLQFSG